MKKVSLPLAIVILLVTISFFPSTFSYQNNNDISESVLPSDQNMPDEINTITQEQNEVSLNIKQAEYVQEISQSQIEGMEILAKVESYYDNALDRLVTILTIFISILVTIVVIVLIPLPLFLEWRREQSFRNEMETREKNLKEHIDKQIESADKDLNKIWQKNLDTADRKLKEEIEESINFLNVKLAGSAAFIADIYSSLKNEYKCITMYYASAIIYSQCEDLEGAKRSLNIILRSIKGNPRLYVNYIIDITKYHTELNKYIKDVDDKGCKDILQEIEKILSENIPKEKTEDSKD